MRRRLSAIVVSCMAAAACAQQAPETPETVHAYSLAELGRHAEAVKALTAIEAKGVLVQEQRAYEFSLRQTQACSPEQKRSEESRCMAEDLLAVGRLPEALAAQKQRIREIETAATKNQRKASELDGAQSTARYSGDTDSTGGRSVALADAYDLRARIEAALGDTRAALRTLDAAQKALPATQKTIARAAGYAYHRALILAEAHDYGAAAKGCSESLRLDAGDQVLGALRQPQCEAIAALATRR